MKNPSFRRKFTLSSGAEPRPSGNGDLPRWNLDHLYSGLDSDDLAADRKRMEVLIAEFRNDYEGGVTWLSGAELGQAIAEYEAIESIYHKIYSYAFLLDQENSANIPKTEPLRKWLTEIGDRYSFFEGEINEMKESDIMTKLSAPEVAVYAPWIASIRADRAYLLTESLEGMSRDLNAASGDAMKRLYDQTMADMRIHWKGKPHSFEEANAAILDPETTLEERRELRGKLADALKQDSARVAFIYNTMVRSYAVDNDLRKYERPDESVNIENRVDARTVDAMFETIKSSYISLSNRFFRWKAEQHGVEAMGRDIMPLPLPKEPKVEEREYSFDEARKIVLRSFRKFSPKFARIAQKFFDEEYIDAEPRPGKDTGGFAMPTGPDNFPYILINYHGKTEDVVSSLGHELGHGVHQALAEKARGNFLSEMPTTVAETASIFAEMLVFEELLRGEKDPAAKRKLLMEKVESMLDNSLRQISYYDFEKRVHEERKGGELSVERLSDIWLDTQKAYFGPGVELDELDRYRWMTIPHFFDTPFYVYSYSFAQVAVSGLFQAYKQAEKEGSEAKEQFVADYIDLLETGITKNLYEMFRPFELDPETPEFWEKGLSLMDKYIGELENPSGKTPKLQDKFNAPPGKPAKNRKPKGPNL